MKILVLNAGSSTLKSMLFEIEQAPPENPPAPLWQGKIEWRGNEAQINSRNNHGDQHSERVSLPRQGSLLRLLDSLWSGRARAISSPTEISAVGHRVVQGGLKYEEPVLLNTEVESAIASLSQIAPLHNQTELEVIRIAREKINAPQVAMFDTGFHRRMPDAAVVYPGPYEWLSEGIRRYGFHGINHQYCAERAAQLLRRELTSLKIVSCHLGSGCSLAAIQNRRSVDTTMGFTPLEGLMMATRSGSIDPGLLTYLLQRDGCTSQELYEILNTKSGLLGISGLSSDMRDILAAMKEGHARATLAFEIFIHRLRSGIGAMAAVLGGMDALVFTAGIGENSPEVRAAACANLRHLGVALDEQKNNGPSSDRIVSAADSAVGVLVIRAQEEWAIARECWKIASSIGRAAQPTAII